jgi:3-oxoacyl-[acyl-carrier protein] reductase/pteridine reductase
MDLNGKTVLVTGGAKRVGRGITVAFAEAGANVVINYNSSVDGARSTLEEVTALGVEGMTFQADVSDDDQVVAMVDAAAERFGTVDVLVNNASVFLSDPVPTDDLTVWRRCIDILVHGSFNCANRVAPLMLEHGRGVIIGIGDLSAFEPWPAFTAHAVGKAAILTLTRQLALELAPTVRANAVVFGPALRPVDYSDEKYERTAQSTLLGRWGTPGEMAHAVRFMAEADYITGEVITVDAGQRYGHRQKDHG